MICDAGATTPLYIWGADPQKLSFLFDKLERDRDKERLLDALEESMKAPAWSVQEAVEVRHVLVPDPRLG